VTSEAYVQSLVRLEAPGAGVRLWRNNVGVLVDKTGRPVRFGLANDTRKLNEELKSGDLIGWRRVLITPEMVGRTIAQIVSRECKPPGWTPAPPGPTERWLHEEAQRRWAALINNDGGDACFATGEGTL
jgi:hypothetical protein